MRRPEFNAIGPASKAGVLACLQTSYKYNYRRRLSLYPPVICRIRSTGLGSQGLETECWRLANGQYQVSRTRSRDSRHSLCIFCGRFPKCQENEKCPLPLVISESEAPETAWRRGYGVATQYRENRASSIRNNQIFRHEPDFVAISRSAEPTGHFKQEAGSI